MRLPTATAPQPHQIYREQRRVMYPRATATSVPVSAAVLPAAPMPSRAPLVSSSSSNKTTEKSFTFLKDGIHFPPVPSTPPPIRSSSGGGGGGGSGSGQGQPEKTAVVHTQAENHPKRTLMESALDVLPHDIDLTLFLQSPQMQMAWYTQLSVTKGEKEATLFKEVIVSMQQNSELLEDMKQQLLMKKSCSASVAINVAWTEAKPEQQQQPSASISSILMPSASSADTFYTLANAAANRHKDTTPCNTSESDFIEEVLNDNSSSWSSASVGSSLNS